MRLLPALFALALPLTAAATALAGDPVAEQAFKDGMDLMGAGKMAEACPKLEASQRLEPRSGTLLLLASCHQEIGRTAKAWSEYLDAATLAETEGRKENAEKAQSLAAALEPKLSRLRIDAQIPQGGVGLTVKLDGKPVLEGTFGSHLPVDPGEHVITASAPGRQEWSTTVKVGPDGDKQVVAIPELDKVAAPPPPPPGPAPGPVPAPVPTTPPDEAGGGGIPAWAWVTGGLGLAVTGVAIWARVDQSAASRALEDKCGADRKSCPAGYDFDADYRREKRDFGLFVGLGLGGVGLLASGIAGIALGASSGGDETKTEARVLPFVSAGPDAVAAGLGGSFQ